MWILSSPGLVKVSFHGIYGECVDCNHILPYHPGQCQKNTQQSEVEILALVEYFFSFGEANIEDLKNLGRGLLSQSINSPPLSMKSEEDELGDVILDDLRGVSWIELMEESIIVVFLLKKNT